jgi:uncharacterized protein (DUF362 family)
MADASATVSVRHWRVFDDLPRVLAACLGDLGGLAARVRPGDRVVIKPNCTADAPASSGGTTHPELVAALIELLRPLRPGRIVVAEGTGRFGPTLETAFPTGGWREMAARLGVELANLDSGPHDEIRLADGRYPGALPFSRLIREADVLITVPCLKTHISADYTVALKNGYAHVPQWKRSEIHRQYLLEQALVDINRIRPADLAVVDAWDGAEGIAGGTDFDRPAGARLLMAAADPVAVDVVAREIMGISAPTRYLDWAIADGLGRGDRACIAVVGDAADAPHRPFMQPGDELQEMTRGLTVCDQRACSGCRVAALAATRRFSDQRLLGPLTLGYGGDISAAPRATPADALGIGHCAVQSGRAGRQIPGCPAATAEIITAVEEGGYVCLRCRELVAEALAEPGGACPPTVRITAAGAEVARGAALDLNGPHTQLLVGECCARYAQVVRDRAAAMGLQPARDVIWLQGCPPAVEEVRAALARISAASPEADPQAGA